jgi:hypothetical protein
MNVTLKFITFEMKKFQVRIWMAFPFPLQQMLALVANRLFVEATKGWRLAVQNLLIQRFTLNRFNFFN